MHHQQGRRPQPGDVSTLTTLSATGYLQPCDVKGEITPHASPASDSRGDHLGRALGTLARTFLRKWTRQRWEGRAGHDRGHGLAQAQVGVGDDLAAAAKPTGLQAAAAARWRLLRRCGRHTRVLLEELTSRLARWSDRSLTVPSVSYHRLHGIRRESC